MWKYQRGMLLLLLLICTSSFMLGIVSPVDLLNPAGSRQTVWSLSSSMWTFLPKFFASGLICLTTGELCLVVVGLVAFVGGTVERTMGTGRYLQLITLLNLLRLPVHLGVYTVTLVTLLSGSGDSAANLALEGTPPAFLVQPSPTWLFTALFTIHFWLIPPRCSFTLYGTIALTEYAAGWIVVFHLAMIRLPFSFLDVLVGVVCGTIACSSYLRIHALEVRWPFSKLDHSEPLTWYSQQPLPQPPQPPTANGGRAPRPSPPPRPEADADPALLSMLESMGFDRATSRAALTRSRNDMDRALNELLPQE